MTNRYHVTVDGRGFTARHGEVLLDAALQAGIDMPHQCRAGHCGTCCVRLTSGHVEGGQSAEPEIVHACQCRVVGNAVIEQLRRDAIRTVEGRLSSLRPLSAEVVEVGISTEGIMPYHAGQYAKLRFAGFPSRPYSITHPVREPARNATVYFHIRQMSDGRVSSALGRRIVPGHKVEMSGPYGTAHFRPNGAGRLILVATNTGFAPIWSIAVAALRENPQRRVMVIAGGRSIDALYMGPALVQLARFPNILVVPVCSASQIVSTAVMPGRPTDYLPRLLATDVLYACGAPGMVEVVQATAAAAGATCFADPFVASAPDKSEARILARAKDWLALPGPTDIRQLAAPPRLPPAPALRIAAARG